MKSKTAKVNEYEIKSYHSFGGRRRILGGSSCNSRMCHPRRTMEELLTNLYEAVEACLSVDLEHIEISKNDRVMEIAV
jgi:hypothetical protein